MPYRDPDRYREYQREYQRAWRANEPEKYAAIKQRRASKKADYQRQWRAANPEKAREYTRRWRDANLDKVRDYHLRRTYGLSLEELDAYLAAQGDRCAICAISDPGNRGWMVDHCHNSGTIRGVLCHRCNAALGLLADDPARMRAAADYIERSRDGRS